MFAVASSRTISLLFLSIALQMQISYLSPTLRLEPFSSISKSRPDYWWSCFWWSKLVRPAFSIILSIYSSLVFSDGSRLKRKLPRKSTGSWGMTVSLSLKNSRDMDEISIPSTRILPYSTSIILAIASPIVDLPAPVLPTMPTLAPASTLNETPFNTKSVFSLYLR